MEENKGIVFRLHEGKLFSTLEVTDIGVDAILGIECFIRGFLAKNGILESQITDVNIRKTLDGFSQRVTITVKYCNFDIFALKDIEMSKRIKIVLMWLGYKEEEIRELKYEEDVLPGRCPYWHVLLDDKEYDFDPDESFSAIDYKKALDNQIREVLGQNRIFIRFTKE